MAGYDFTFSVPKSASVLWAVADARTQAEIVEAHHAAVAEVLAFMERELASTRVGVAAADGAVAQVAVSGLIAAAFDHFDSRAGDPHLHTHVVVSNKVSTVMDERWRSLERAAAARRQRWRVSELHEAVFADRLSRVLGVGWAAAGPGTGSESGLLDRIGTGRRWWGSSPSRSRHIEGRERPADRGVRGHARPPAVETADHQASSAGDLVDPPRQGDPLPGGPDWRLADTGHRGPRSGCDGLGIRRGPRAGCDVAGLWRATCRRRRGRPWPSRWSRWWGRSGRHGDAGTSTRRLSVRPEVVSFVSTAERETLPRQRRGCGRECVAAADAHASWLRLRSCIDVRMAPSCFRPRYSTVYSSEALLAAEDRLLQPAATRERQRSRPRPSRR